MRLRSFLFLSLILPLVVGVNSACSSNQTAASIEPKAESVLNATADAEVAAAQKAIEKEPNSPAGYNRLASVYIKRARETGDFSLNSTAENAVNRALEIKADDETANMIKASLHLTFHRFNDALTLATELQKKYPKEAFFYGVLTDANVELGNYPAAVKAAQTMVDTKPNSSSYARVAHLRSLHGDSDGAIEMFTTAARAANPMDKEAQSWYLVQIGEEFWKVGKYDEAEKAYDEALANFPNYYHALAGKGRVYAAKNDFDNAVKFLTDANNRVPDVQNTILLGDIYRKQGNEEKARQQYGLVEIIEQKLGTAGEQRQLALLWADHGEKLDEALTIARREHELRKDIYTADTLAWVLYKKNQHSEAKKISAEAMRLKTKDARILYHAGMIENALGNKAEAKRLLDAALKLNPAFDLRQADDARAALQQLN